MSREKFREVFGEDNPARRVRLETVLGEMLVRIEALEQASKPAKKPASRAKKKTSSK